MKLKTIAIIFMIGLLLFGMIGCSIAFDFNDKTYVVTVTDKERITGNETSRYLVFCDDEQGNSLVFENTDCLLRGKFNSSNIQGSLKEGTKYELTVVGYRIPFLSFYENIIAIKKL